MEIALIGYGRMGSLMDEVACSQGHDLVARFTSEKPFSASEAPGRGLGDGVVLIDFTVPDAVAATVGEAANLGRPIVVGTTGWKSWAKGGEANPDAGPPAPANSHARCNLFQT